jgi:hypothetical protein
MEKGEGKRASNGNGHGRNVHGGQMATDNNDAWHSMANIPLHSHAFGPASEHDPDELPDTVRMITHEDAARASLRASILALGLDEVRVLQRIADRLRAGQRQYGFLRIGADPRAFRDKEAREEIEDALVYLACSWLKTELQEAP